MVYIELTLLLKLKFRAQGQISFVEYPLYRILKYNGISILQVPMNVKRKNTFEDSSIKSKNQREKYFGQYDHVREYGLDFKDRVEQAGFKVEMINYSKKISEDLVIKYGLMKDDLIPIGKKLPSN